MLSFEEKLLVESTITNSDFEKIVKIVEDSDTLTLNSLYNLLEFEYSVSSIKRLANRVLNSSQTRNYALGGAVAGSLFGPIGSLLGIAGGALYGGAKSLATAKADLVRDKISTVRPTSKAKELIEDGDEREIANLVIQIKANGDLENLNIEEFLEFIQLYRDDSLSKEDALHLEQIVTLTLQRKIQHIGKLI